MKYSAYLPGFVFGLAAISCSDPSNFPNNSCADIDGTCVEVRGGNESALLEATNAAEPGTTIILGKGTFELVNSVEIDQSGIHLIGQGIDVTTLSFGEATAQFNGVDVVGDDFLIQDLTVLDAPIQGIRVDGSNGVVFRRVRATWTEPNQTSNGAYGIYPVKSQNVLVEDSRAENASDAGLYVGQCQNVIVRNNVVTGNVAGLEIENTQYADVYGNTAEGNTGGIVVFDLPGNPIVGRDVRLRNNIIRNNNNPNFAAGGTVAQIPAGTGTFAMASRRVEITGNTYEGNDTIDIAIISGLAVVTNTASWVLETATLEGDWSDLGLLSPGAGQVTNFRTENVLVSGNTHSNSGLNPDTNNQFGIALAAVYSSLPAVDSVIYDSIGEMTFDATVAANNSNTNNICAGGNVDGTFGSIDLASQLMGVSPILHLETAPFAPFDCLALSPPVAEVVLP